MRPELTAGTRRSALALWQTRWVIARLTEAFPGLVIHEQQIVTQGDRIQDRPLSKIGDKGLFTHELEEALEQGEVDFAVHSLKDLPTSLPPGLCVGSMPARVSPEDLLVSPQGLSLADLPPGTRVGTGSLRRRALLLNRRPDLVIEEIRGNVDTRLRKLADGEYDAIMLAEAGFRRLERPEKGYVLDNDWYYAPGQGALAIEVRSDDAGLIRALRSLEPAGLRETVGAEREFLAELEGGCQIPLGVRSILKGNELELRGMVASLDGKRMVENHLAIRLPPPTEPILREEAARRLGSTLARMLVEQGAGVILDEIRAQFGQL